MSKLRETMRLIQRFLQVMQQEGVGAAIHRMNAHRRSGASRPLGSAHANESTIIGSQIDLWLELGRKGGLNITQPPAYHRRERRIALIGDLNLPQCRKYRVEQLAEHWHNRGIDFTFAHYQDTPRAMDALQTATHLFEYRLSSNDFTHMYRYEARRLRLPVLYDIDDPLFSISAYASYGNMNSLNNTEVSGFVRQSLSYLDAMNGADMITLSTPALVKHAGLYTSRDTSLRRNFADRETLDEGERVAAYSSTNWANDGSFRFAFPSGSRGREADLASISSALFQLMEKHKNVKLMAIGPKMNLGAAGLPMDCVEQFPFSEYRRYLALLASSNCILLPLEDNTFNRCKSAVRVIDAWSVGTPVIIDPIGDARELVQSGRNGLVASSSEEWLAALEAMVTDKAFARNMGLQARHDLERNWSNSDSQHITDEKITRWVLN